MAAPTTLLNGIIPLITPAAVPADSGILNISIMVQILRVPKQLLRYPKQNEERAMLQEMSIMRTLDRYLALLIKPYDISFILSVELIQQHIKSAHLIDYFNKIAIQQLEQSIIKMRSFRSVSFLFSQAKLNVLICPDKFKFSLSAQEVALAVQQNIPSYCGSKILTLADGGEGSLEAISKIITGKWINCSVSDPLFRRIKSRYYLGQNQQSYIEMAKASGLQLLLPNERNPLQTTSFGTGQLIMDSLKRGHKKINLLIGGSATNDGGIGLANALGYEFVDKNGIRLKPVGKNLISIKNITKYGQFYKNKFSQSSINVYTDVTNVFTGINGATRIYGPQKGATPSAIQLLEQGMANLRQILIKLYNVDANQIQGSGAAGGLGGACSILLDSKLKRGIDLMFSINNFQNWVKESDLIITGEGKVDGQTMKGKVVNGVIQIAKKYNKKVLILCAFCENRQQIQDKLDSNVQLLEVLSKQQRSVIDANLTKSRINSRLKQYFDQQQQ